MNNKNSINPLSKSSSVVKVDAFNVEHVISAYKQMDINVSRFFYDLKTIDLYECTDTSYRFYYPFSAIGDAEFYEDLSLTRKNYYKTRWEHLEILNKIQTNETVLEIGSGFGAFLSLLKSKKIEAEGIELNPEAVSQCKAKDLKVNNILIDAFAKKSTKQFDIVCFFQVLEHITDVHDFIESSLLTLKPNGKLVIGVPNNNPYLFVNDKYHTLNLPPHHAGLWNKKTLKSLEKIFPVKLENVMYEPLENVYSQFLNVYIKNSSNFYANVLEVLNRVMPKLLKWILCKSINGRNILVVFRKTSDE